MNKKINIVIPMVGVGKRFLDSGFRLPKPLIQVREKAIVQHAIESLDVDGNYIFIVRTSEFSEELKFLLKSIKPDCHIIEIDYLTDGSVSSILLAEKFINNDEELITTNCDQRTDWSGTSFLDFCRNSNADGVVVTYPYDGIILNEKSPYSFIQVDESGNALRLEEKFAISNNALCGIHYWAKGKDFISSAQEMIKNNDRTNNEFYVAKTYNYLIKSKKTIKHYPIKKSDFFSLGTPEDVKKFNGIKNEFNSFKPSTIFCDLDGTIIKHLHSFSDVTFVKPELLPGVREKFDEWDSKGFKIILVTARKESARLITELHLRELGIPYDQLIMGVASGNRILINDKMFENIDRASAVNIITNEGFNNVEWAKHGL
jgi:NDP-sugar pyrophosphorylase family protein